MSTLEQAISEGYKQTDVGVIPIDWESINFGDLFEQSISRKPIKAGDPVTFIGMQDVSESAQLTNPQQRVFEQVKTGFTYFERNDVLVAKITPCFENGKGCYTDKIITRIGFGSTEFHVLRAKENSDAKFIYFWTTRNSLRQDLEGEMVGSAGHRRVPFSAIQNYLIPCPSSRIEQTAIANALSDVDALLTELENLIAKKQAIKTATMQQLLTGKTRLPQFATYTEGEKQGVPEGKSKGTKPSELGEIPEDWDILPFGKIFTYQNGKAQEHLFNSNDGYKVISIGNYSENGKYVETGSYIDKKHENEIGRFVLKKDELAMILNDKTAVGTIIGRVILIDKSDTYVMNQRTMRLSPSEEFNSHYLFALINSEVVHKRIVGMAKPGTQIYINTDDVLDFQVQLPTSREEQTAIAQIHIDMDNEIQTLEKRLAKTRQIKQGMMQELLTGRTRLPF